MGGAYKEEFSPEELAALGEEEGEAAPVTKDEAPKGPDTQDGTPAEGDEKPPAEDEEPPKTEPKTAEPTAEEKTAAEEMGFKIHKDDNGKIYVIDEDGTRIPPARWSKIYREAKEGERTKDKLDLIKKIGPEEYYRIYPDEKPADYRPQEAAPKPKPEEADPMSLVANYQDPDHPYNGKTLAELYEIDANEARRLEKEWEKSRPATKPTQADQTVDQQTLNECQKEIDAFAVNISSELFGKEAAALTDEEKTKIGDTIQTTLAWMAKTGRGGGMIADAYFLMNREGIIKRASTKAAEKAIKELSEKKGPPSIDTGSGGDVKGTGLEAYENMTEDQLTKAIDKMTDSRAAQFFKTAPQSLQKKYPGLPWG